MNDVSEFKAKFQITFYLIT